MEWTHFTPKMPRSLVKFGGHPLLVSSYHDNGLCLAAKQLPLLQQQVSTSTWNRAPPASAYDEALEAAINVRLIALVEPSLSANTVSGRKRKVKCQLTDEDVETCAECVKSNSRCTLQQPETELSGRSSLAHSNKQEHELRLERIELLLNKLVEAQQPSQLASGSLDPEPIVPSSLWNDLVSFIKQTVFQIFDFSHDASSFIQHLMELLLSSPIIALFCRIHQMLSSYLWPFCHLLKMQFP